MSIPILEACRKRNRSPKLFNFRTFGDPGSPISPNGPFRDNIRLFVQHCAEREEYEVEGMRVWCTLLVIEDKNFVVPLYTIEEEVNHSTNPLCDHCRCTGWGRNLVSKRKYHMIIPTQREWSKRLSEGVCGFHTHLLHGLIHSNGFGHLLCINGIEGGSKFLCGREIMDLWDRICSNLRARKISVEDVSKKHSMDLRLVYGVAYGYSWFGRWGYRFCHGAFGVTEENYRRAIEILSSLELDGILGDFKDADQFKQIKYILLHYKNLSDSQLVTFADLLRLMLTVKSCWSAKKKLGFADVSGSSGSRSLTRAAVQKKPVAKEKITKFRKFSNLTSTMDSRWPSRRLEYAAEVIVEALKEKKDDDQSGYGGMTRQDVRDAARLQIGDTGLLDYVLKSMNNVIVGTYVVHRAVNPRTRILEYSIEELGDSVGSLKGMEKEAETIPVQPSTPVLVPGDDVYDDMVYLYNNVLLNHPKSELIELAAQAILDSKLFVKEWPIKDEKDHVLRYICCVIPDSIDLPNETCKELPPGVVVTVPLQANVLELKRAAEIALRDTYCLLANFTVLDLVHADELEDEQSLFATIESGAEIVVRGIGMDLNTKLKFEGGTENWKVTCECGARDDDGERMVECDVCEVWQHTRCSGIEDYETVPPLFICSGCCSSLAPPRNEPLLEFVSCEDLLMISDHGLGAELLC